MVGSFFPEFIPLKALLPYLADMHVPIGDPPTSTALLLIDARCPCQAEPLDRADLAYKARKRNPGWKNNHRAFDSKVKSGYSRANFSQLVEMI